MESGRSANPIEDLRTALEKETRKRQALEQQLSEALTLLQKAMKDREKFRNLVEDTTAVIFATDPKGITTYISPIIHAFTGMQPEDLLGREFMTVIHPEDRRRLQKLHERVISGDLRSIEYRIRHKHHGYCWVRSFSRPLINDEEFKGLHGVMVDISDLKSAEAAFRESEKNTKPSWRALKKGILKSISRATWPLSTRLYVASSGIPATNFC